MYNCRNCASKHHSLLHFDTRASKNVSPTNGATHTTQPSSMPPHTTLSRETEGTSDASFVGTSYVHTNVLLGYM